MDSDYSTISEDSVPPIRAYGHTYHGSGRIMLPNDEAGAQHMALFHELYKLCLKGRLTDSKLRIERGFVDRSREVPGGNRGLPTSSTNPTATASDSSEATPYQILDVGSGSGLWAIEMAQTFPEAEILGIDLTSALLPKDVPPNLTFEILDASEPWGPKLYDLIHMRSPVGGGIKDWPAFVAEAWAHLKPGGQIEFSSMRPKFYGVEPTEEDLPEGETPEIGTACKEFEITFAAMCEAQGIDFDPLARVGIYLARLGADSVRERGDWLPVKDWGGDSITRRKGELAERIIDIGMEQWALMIFGKCGWSEEDTRDLIRRVQEEIKDPELKSMFRL